MKSFAIATIIVIVGVILLFMFVPVDTACAAVMLLGLGSLGIVFYFIPTLVAIFASSKNILPIFVLNLFGGWTFVGWLVALVWAVCK